MLAINLDSSSALHSNDDQEAHLRDERKCTFFPPGLLTLEDCALVLRTKHVGPPPLSLARIEGLH